ncbi:hypothetical protein [Aliiruegeria lutimaris]|nr:hypothetical protein [Aliiruegeria lutimaris]
MRILYRGGLVAQKVRAFVDFAAPRLEAALTGTPRPPVSVSA